MTRLLVALCLAVAAEEPAAWTSAVERFTVGVEQFQAGHPSYEQLDMAANEFERIVAKSPRHVEAYLNLGKARAVSGQIPEAIAAWRAGLAVDPFDRRIHECLAEARRQVSIPHDSKLVAAASDWGPILSMRDFSKIALIVAAIALPAGFRSGDLRWTKFGRVALFVGLLAGAATFQAIKLDRLEYGRGVVVRDEMPLRVGNADSYELHPDAPLLPRGYEVQRLAIRGGWLHVECPGGQIGWIKMDAAINVGQAF